MYTPVGSGVALALGVAVGVGFGPGMLAPLRGAALGALIGAWAGVGGPHHGILSDMGMFQQLILLDQLFRRYPDIL